MEARNWIALFKRYPPELQEILVIVTLTGVEINVQSILRMESDHVVVRGRVGGTTDAGRAFFVPYDQICFLNFSKEVRETEIRRIYGEIIAEPSAPGTSTEVPPAEKKPEPAPEPATAPQLQPKSGPRTVPTKQSILDRLRARTAGGSQQPPPPSSTK